MLNIFTCKTLHTETVIWYQIAPMLLCIPCMNQFFLQDWKYTSNMVKMKIFAGRTEAEYVCQVLLDLSGTVWESVHSSF